MITKTGNIIDLAEQGHLDLIIQGCNCFHKMRSGLAKEISRRYPQAEQADLHTPYGDVNKLGTFSCASSRTESLKDCHTFHIVNVYTQYRWSGREDVFEYKKFGDFLQSFPNSLFCQSLPLRATRKINIGFPKIGCGCAKGDENLIIPMIEKFSHDNQDWSETILVTR